MFPRIVASARRLPRIQTSTTTLPPAQHSLNKSPFHSRSPFPHNPQIVRPQTTTPSFGVGLMPSA